MTLGAFDETITKDDVQMMAEAGFIAIGKRWHIKADIIFNGLRLLRPLSELPIIGFCMNLIAKNKLDMALALLEECSSLFEQNASSYHHILKAIVLRLMKRPKDALAALSLPNTNWGEYAGLANALQKDLMRSC